MIDKWTKRQHASNLLSLAEEIRSLAGQIREAQQLDDASEMYLTRTEAMATYATDRALKGDPRVMPDGIFDVIEGPLANAVSHLKEMRTDSSGSHASAAAAQIEAIFPNLAQLPPMSRRGISESASATRAFVTALEGLEQRLAEIATNTQSQAETAAARIEAFNSTATDVAGSVDALGVAAATEIARQIDAFAAEAASQKARIDQFVQTATTELATDRSAMRSSSDTKLKEALEDFDKLSNKDLLAFRAETEQRVSEIQERLDFFDGQRTETNRVLGAVASRETAGAYLEEHRNQKADADRWRKIAVGLWLLLIVVAIIGAVHLGLTAADLSTTRLASTSAAKLGVTGAIAGVAAWCSAQAGHHRARERAAIGTASELTTLRPFIAQLPAEKQNDLIAEALGRYFPGKPLK